jgi:hypothetical protein
VSILIFSVCTISAARRILLGLLTLMAAM